MVQVDISVVNLLVIVRNLGNIDSSQYFKQFYEVNL